jgi:ClpP class serine protease
MPKAKSKAGSRRPVERCEALAIHRAVVSQSEPGAFFWLMGPSVASNERVGEGDRVAVVNVRGPLEQFADCWGENYESIIARVRQAMTGEDVKQAQERARKMAQWNGEEVSDEPISAEPPACVVMRISSPGGVVAGLNETVRKLQALSAAHGIPMLAYVDEMAASAAYALACACEEIYLPASGVVGSIGVISHMWSIARANDDDGIDVEVIASGAFKADGNENLPIEDDAIMRERARVEKLAGQFFRLVSQSRGIPVAQIQGFEAGIYLGSDGVKSGLADDVMGWDEFVAQIGIAYGGTSVAPLARDGTSQTGGDMLRLQALIARTKKDIAKAKGKAKADLEAKLSRLTASVADLKAYKKTKYVKEEETSEEDGEEEEESDAEGEDAEEDAEDEPPPDDDKKEKKSKRKSEEDAEDDGDEAESEDDEPDKDAEDDADAEEAIAALTGSLKGKAQQKARGLFAALLDKARAYDKLQPTVAQLQATEKDRKRSALIDGALKDRRITKAHGKMLRQKPLAFVRDFLSMHKKPLYFTADDELVPGESPAGASGSVPQDVAAIIDAAVNAQMSVMNMRGSEATAKRAELHDAAVKRWRETQNGAARH